VGEGIALRDLLVKGFAILKWNTPEQLPGSEYIEAEEPVTKKHIFVQVNSAVTPNVPSNLSSDEEGNLKSHAARKGGEAWEVKVQLVSSLKEGTVTWRQLV